MLYASNTLQFNSEAPLHLIDSLGVLTNLQPLNILHDYSCCLIIDPTFSAVLLSFHIPLLISSANSHSLGTKNYWVHLGLNLSQAFQENTLKFAARSKCDPKTYEAISNIRASVSVCKEPYSHFYKRLLSIEYSKMSMNIHHVLPVLPYHHNKQ